MDRSEKAEVQETLVLLKPQRARHRNRQAAKSASRSPSKKKIPRDQQEQVQDVQPRVYDIATDVPKLERVPPTRKLEIQLCLVEPLNQKTFLNRLTSTEPPQKETPISKLLKRKSSMPPIMKAQHKAPKLIEYGPGPKIKDLNQQLKIQKKVLVAPSLKVPREKAAGSQTMQTTGQPSRLGLEESRVSFIHQQGTSMSQLSNNSKHAYSKSMRQDANNKEDQPEPSPGLASKTKGMALDLQQLANTTQQQKDYSSALSLHSHEPLSIQDHLLNQQPIYMTYDQPTQRSKKLENLPTIKDNGSFATLSYGEQKLLDRQQAAAKKHLLLRNIAQQELMTANIDKKIEHNLHTNTIYQNSDYDQSSSLMENNGLYRNRSMPKQSSEIFRKHLMCPQNITFDALKNQQYHLRLYDKRAAPSTRRNGENESIVMQSASNDESDASTPLKGLQPVVVEKLFDRGDQQRKAYEMLNKLRKKNETRNRSVHRVYLKNLNPIKNQNYGVGQQEEDRKIFEQKRRHSVMEMHREPTKDGTQRKRKLSSISGLTQGEESEARTYNRSHLAAEKSSIKLPSIVSSSKMKDWSQEKFQSPVSNYQHYYMQSPKSFSMLRGMAEELSSMNINTTFQHNGSVDLVKGEHQVAVNQQQMTSAEAYLADLNELLNSTKDGSPGRAGGHLAPSKASNIAGALQQDGNDEVTQRKSKYKQCKNKIKADQRVHQKIAEGMKDWINKEIRKQAQQPHEQENPAQGKNEQIGRKDSNLGEVDEVDKRESEKQRLLQEFNKDINLILSQFKVAQPLYNQLLQKWKNEVYLKKYQQTKEQELEDLKKVEDEVETLAIFMEHAQKAANKSPYNNNNQQQALNKVMQYFGDAFMKKDKLAVIDEGIEQSELSEYLQYQSQLQQLSSYDPQELNTRKKQFMKEVKDEIAAFRNEEEQEEEKRLAAKAILERQQQNRILLALEDRKQQQKPRIVEQVEYAEMMKEGGQSSVAAMLNTDPKFQFYKNLVKNKEMPQSFLDGMMNQTLIIRERNIRVSLLRALSESFKYFNDFVSKLILDKNGLSDADFAMILEPLSQFKQFRSITYRRNELGFHALRFLRPLLTKRIPFHLEELRIEHCSMTVSVSEELVHILASKTFLKKLSLVNVRMTDETFHMLTKYIRKHASHVTEFNIAQNTVRPCIFLTMLSALARNENLKYINISGNHLLTTGSNYKQTLVADKKGKHTSTYSYTGAAESSQSMQELKNQIRAEQASLMKLLYEIFNSKSLQHIDLTETGLDARMIFKLCELAKKSNSLQSVHFCNNPGVTAETKQRIQQLFQQPKPNIEKAPFIMQKELSDAQKKKQIEDAAFLKQVWHKRQLYSCDEADAMAAAFDQVPTNQEHQNLDKKLIIQRICGFQDICQDKTLNQWKMATGEDSHCWICERYRFTVLLWNPPIHGKGKQEEYKESPLINKDCFGLGNQAGVPQFYAANTGWKPVNMIKIEEFCKDIDHKLPDIFKNMQGKGGCRSFLTDEAQFNEEEAQLYDQEVKNYMKTYQSIYLDVFDKNFKFKEPFLINLDSKEVKNDLFSHNRYAKREQLYCHTMFLRPGKHQYLVRSPADDLVQYSCLCDVRDEDFPESLLFNEDLPEDVQEKKFVRETSIFADFKVDNEALLAQCFRYDSRYWKVGRLTRNAEDLELAFEILRENYQFLKDIFLTTMAASRYPYVTLLDFSKFIQSCKLIDSNLNLGAVDRIFLAANLSADLSASGTSAFKTMKMLNRHQFIEALARCAQIKYQQPSSIPSEERKLPIAITKLLAVLKQTAYLQWHQNSVRSLRELLWEHQANGLFKKNEAKIRSIMEMYIKGNNVTEQYMTFANVMDLFCVRAEAPMREKALQRLYACSKMTNVEELSESSPYKYNRLRFVEFLELIARIAEAQFEGSHFEHIDLCQKIVEVLDWMYSAAGVDAAAVETPDEQDSEAEDFEWY